VKQYNAFVSYAMDRPATRLQELLKYA
jgi:hypothetical protein